MPGRTVNQASQRPGSLRVVPRGVSGYPGSGRPATAYETRLPAAWTGAGPALAEAGQAAGASLGQSLLSGLGIDRIQQKLNLWIENRQFIGFNLGAVGFGTILIIVGLVGLIQKRR